MPRPTQRRDGVVRSITYPVKFTSIEYGQLKMEAYQNNISVAELIRDRALNRTVQTLPPPLELDAKFLEQLLCVGKPLNVIARKANTQRKADLALTLDTDEIQRLLDTLLQILKQIRETISQPSAKPLSIESRRGFNKAPLAHSRSIRLAADEYEYLKQKAALAHTSVSKFMRLAARRQSVVSPPPPPLSHWEIHAALSKITNNLRQLNSVLLGQPRDFPLLPIEPTLTQIQSVGWQLLGGTGEEELEV
jgi:hypothetical protein